MTKRKDNKIKRTAFKKRSLNRKPGDADTIPSFCESEAISESQYYKLKRLHKGPREMLVENSVRISPEAKADWRREREAETVRDTKKAEAKSMAASLPQTSANVTD